MDIAVLFGKLCQVKIRRLLLLLGIIVAFVVGFQCFAFPFGELFSLSPEAKGSISLMVGEVTLLNSSESTNSHVVHVVSNNKKVSNSEEEAGYENEIKGRVSAYGSASDNDTQLGYSFEIYKNRNLHNEFTSEKGTRNVKSFSAGSNKIKNDSFVHVDATNTRYDPQEKVESSNDNFKQENTDVTLQDVRYQTGFSSLPLVSMENSAKGVRDSNTDSRISVLPVITDRSSVKNVKKRIKKQSVDKSTDILRTVSAKMNNNSARIKSYIMKRRVMPPTSISHMNSLLVQSVVSSSSKRPRWSSTCDQELLSAKLQIENAPIISKSPGVDASLFRNISMFKRSYELMESMLKVYIYNEGDKPIFHQPLLNGIYASEGWFMKLLEANNQFVVKDPRKAHLFYLPFSSKRLRTVFDEENARSWRDLMNYLDNYVDLIAGKYRFWNRTEGADHFLVACHDWAGRVTRQRMQNCIRSLCNANIGKGFKIGKDSTLPVTYVRKEEEPLRDLGGKLPSERPILAFFAGSMHGYLRPILLQYWGNKEPDMKIFNSMPRDTRGKKSYREHMRSSKYCICARGYEVHTPRVIEAIFSECVPVIISDNYVPPFFEVLDWEAFAVFVQEKDIPNLRNILLSIPKEKYIAMQTRVKMVQQHFFWHKNPVKFDLFHMILHSVWYTRVFQMKAR